VNAEAGGHAWLRKSSLLMECRGLILSETGRIHAIPELEGTRRDVEMTQEAAVGKIAPEEIEYLIARGLTQEEATAAIVRGFPGHRDPRPAGEHPRGDRQGAAHRGEPRRILVALSGPDARNSGVSVAELPLPFLLAGDHGDQTRELF
jgi:hypothetical protein